MADRAQINAVIKGDARGFNKSIDSASNKAKSFATGALKQMGGAIVAAFAIQRVISFGKEILQLADDIQTTANTFDIAVESVVAWKGVMAESGIGVDRFMKMFGRMVSAQADARKGLTTYVDALRDMNISARDFSSLKVDKLMELMAKRYQEAGDKMMFLGGAAKLLGTRIGPGLIEVFQRVNEEGMGGFTEEAEKSVKAVEDLAALSDKIEKFWSNFEMGAIRATGALIDFVKETNKSIQEDPVSIMATASFQADEMARIEAQQEGKEPTSNFWQVEGGYFQKYFEKLGEIYYNKQLGLMNEAGEDISFWKPKVPLKKPEETPEAKEDTSFDIEYSQKLEDKKFAYKLKNLEAQEKIYLLKKKEDDLLTAYPFGEDFDTRTKADIKLLDLRNKIYDLQVKINKEQEKGLKDYFKDEEAFAKKLSKGKKGKEEEQEPFREERFNELARVGGQVGGQANFAAGNAIKAINVAEKQVRIAEASDKKLSELVVIGTKNNNANEAKNWDEGAVLG